MRSRIAPFFFAALLVAAGGAKAQFVQYTQPGGPEDRPEDRRERLEREMEEAPHRLGPARIAPAFGLRDMAYVRNLFASEGEADSDLTATLAGGFRAYLRTGPKAVWVAHALPEYVWWRERSEERRLNQRFGITGYGFFNHLTVELAAERDEQQQIQSPEVPRPASGRSDRARITAELKPTGHFSVFATASQSRIESLADDSEDPLVRGLSLLDRDERVARTGVRWTPREGWMVGVGTERSDVEFHDPLLDASSSGTAPVLEAMIDRRRFFLQLDLAARSLEARTGSRFVDFEGTTGSLAVSIRPRQRLEFWAYANRNLVYSLSLAYPYLDDRRHGLAVEVGLGETLALRVFGETGVNDYVAGSFDVPDRRDDLTSFGGSLRVDLPGSVDMGVRVVRTEFDSDLPGADRTLTTGGLSVTLGGFL